MKVNIQIDTKTFVRFWLVVIGFALALLLLYSARTGLIIVGTALFLALALNGPVSKLAKYMPGRSRAGSTVISFILIIAFIGTFMFLAVPPIVQQTAKFAETVPTLFNNATNSWHSLDNIIEQYNLRPQVDTTLNDLQGNASKWASNVGANIASSLGSIAALFGATFLVLILSILMLIEGPDWMQRIWKLYRDEDKMRRHQNVASQMHSVVSGYVIGQLTVSAIGATFAGIAVFVISLFFQEVPSNLAIPTAAITFIFSLIPMFGATIGGTLICILLGFNIIAAAVIYLIYFIVYQQIENNLISPTIQAKRVSLSPLVILSSVTIGLYLFGIAGGIISIPIAGCVKVLLEDYLAYSKKERKKEEKPMHRLAKKLASHSED